MAPNPFDVHTEVVEEVREKIFFVLADLDLMGKPTSKPVVLPENELALLTAIGECKALSAKSRRAVGDGIAALSTIDVARRAATPDVRRQADACCAIIYASQSRADLKHGLALITKLFATREAADGVKAVKDMIKSGEGRIYPRANQPLLYPGLGTSLPQAVFSAKTTLICDAGAAVGAITNGIRDPRAIAAIALSASLVASAEAVLEWIFPDQVPLFPQGSTGPYNPYPSPNPL